MQKRHQPFTLEEFRSIYSRVPRLCVDLVIQTEAGTLLTLRRNNGWINQWHFPGGTVYYGQSIEETIHRVAQEELGVDVEVIKFLKYIEFPSEIKERGYGQSISLAFLCKPLSTDIKICEEASSFGFFKEIPNNTIIEVKQFLSSL